MRTFRSLSHACLLRLQSNSPAISVAQSLPGRWPSVGGSKSNGIPEATIGICVKSTRWIDFCCSTKRGRGEASVAEVPPCAPSSLERRPTPSSATPWSLVRSNKHKRPRPRPLGRARFGAHRPSTGLIISPTHSPFCLSPPRSQPLSILRRPTHTWLDAVSDHSQKGGTSDDSLPLQPASVIHGQSVPRHEVVGLRAAR
jgi:hypothetical protein